MVNYGRELLAGLVWDGWKVAELVEVVVVVEEGGTRPQQGSARLPEDGTCSTGGRRLVEQLRAAHTKST